MCTSSGSLMVRVCVSSGSLMVRVCVYIIWVTYGEGVCVIWVTYGEGVCVIWVTYGVCAQGHKVLPPYYMIDGQFGRVPRPGSAAAATWS